MCLGIPSRITEIWEEDGTRMAHVDAAGETKRVCLAYLPDIAVGDYTVVHAGFALTRLDQETALSTLTMMRELGIVAAEPVPSEHQVPGIAGTTDIAAGTGEHR